MGTGLSGLPPWRQRVLSWDARAVLLEHRIADPRWTARELRIAVLSDLHVGAPWVPLGELERIAVGIAGLRPDLIVVAGDFLISRWLPARRAAAADIVAALSPLAAPLGVFAVLGNHDWRDCDLARATGRKRNAVREALEASPIRLLENRAERLDHGGAFWLVGLDSQKPTHHRNDRAGRHDPDSAFADVPEGAAAILLAHEPDYFARQDPRAFLQISGHTHGGQANLLGWRPLTPSAHGGRYAWGHIREGGRHLVVSGGVGYSGLPLRLFQPPEITLVSLTGQG